MKLISSPSRAAGRMRVLAHATRSGRGAGKKIKYVEITRRVFSFSLSLLRLHVDACAALCWDDALSGVPKS